VYYVASLGLFIGVVPLYNFYNLEFDSLMCIDKCPQVALNCEQVNSSVFLWFGEDQTVLITIHYCV